MIGGGFKTGVIVDIKEGKEFIKKDGTKGSYVYITVKSEAGKKYKKEIKRSISIEAYIFEEIFKVSYDNLIGASCFYIKSDDLEYKFKKPDNMSDEMYAQAVEAGWDKQFKKEMVYRDNKVLEYFEVTELANGKACFNGEYAYVNDHGNFANISVMANSLRKSL